MAFDGKSAGRKNLLDAFGLGRGVRKPDSLISRDFLIILRKTSIFSLYFICADAMTAATAEITALKIVYCVKKDMSKVSS